MKKLFDQVSESCSRIVSESYSTSFTLATKMLDSSIRQDIYNIYGFVRFADEIVDSFHNYDKKELLNLFEKDLKKSIDASILIKKKLNSKKYVMIIKEVVNIIFEKIKENKSNPYPKIIPTQYGILCLGNLILD